MLRWVLGRVLLVVALLLGGAFVADMPSALGTPSSSGATDLSGYVTMDSAPGDFIGLGHTYLWESPGPSLIQVSSPTDGAVQVDVADGQGAPGERFTFEFAAPFGAALTPGTYGEAVRVASRDSSHPGIDVYGDQRGCNQASGSFTVHALTADRVWITYEEHCESMVPALFGEIRLGEPRSPGLQVAAHEVDWPSVYLYHHGRDVPITITNSRSHQEAVTNAAVSDGAADFMIESDRCGTLDPGRSCVVWVRFAPSAAGDRTGQLVIEDSTGARHTVDLAGPGDPTYSSWMMHGQTGDRLGEDRDWAYRAPRIFIWGTGDDTAVHLNAQLPNGLHWNAIFAPASGATLNPGTTYTNAAAWGSDIHQNRMAVLGFDGVGCTDLTGEFTIEQAAYQLDGAVTSFAVTFTLHCDGESAATYGSIAWHSTQPPTPLPPHQPAPPPAQNLSVESTGINSLTLGWDDPDSTDWADTAITATPQGKSASPTSLIATSTNGTAFVTGLTPNRSYTFQALSRNIDRDSSPGAPSVTAFGTTLVIAADKSRVTLGHRVTLTGTLTRDDAENDPVGTGPVKIYAAPAGTHRWHLLATPKMHADGTFTVRVQVSRPTDFEGTFTGDTQGPDIGTISAPIRVGRTA
ncbi:MAG: fibronectin type III domain-containing protein [Gordonia polyisoprenivorans]|nr:fibronectin type III domain-containing protein [Gordonia polyisoprenivorans]